MYLRHYKIIILGTVCLHGIYTVIIELYLFQVVSFIDSQSTYKTVNLARNDTLWVYPYFISSNTIYIRSNVFFLVMYFLKYVVLKGIILRGLDL